MRHFGLHAMAGSRRTGVTRGSRELARSSRIGRIVVVAALAGVMTGCSWMRDVLDPSNVDYKSAKTGPGLDVPPDLIGPRGDDRYVIPGAGTGKTYSDYSRDRQDRASQAATQAPAGAVGGGAGTGGVGVLPAIDPNALLPSTEGARIERDGQVRWLVVDQAPERVWPQVVAFWQAEGIPLRDESPALGTMETEWVTRGEQPERGGIRGLFSRAIGSTYTTSMKDAYRTRIERAAGGGTEIYVSQRALEEVVNSPRQDSTIWQPGPNRPELEVEMLRRMMLRIGRATVPESRAAVAGVAGVTPAAPGSSAAPAAAAATAVAPAATPAPATASGRAAAEPDRPDRAVVVSEQGGLNGLRVNEGFERAWREVGLAIDRIGFTVEDRDRSKGTYFVRYVDLDRRDPRQGALSRMFSGERKDLSGQRYQIRVAGDGGAATRVDVRGDAGDTPGTEADVRVANRIVALLHERMR